MIDRFDPDWLALREPFDFVARSMQLVAELASHLPPRPRFLDLAAGIGGMLRFLAPIIGRAQSWTLLEENHRLLDEAFNAIEMWARLHHWTVTAPGRAMLVHTPRGTWRIEGRVDPCHDVAAALSASPADVVLSNALLDNVSTAWLQRFAGAVRSPVLATLVADGHVSWLPRHPFDRLVGVAATWNQHHNKGLGPALGAWAAGEAVRAFAAAGLIVRTAPSIWRVAPGQAAMAATLVRATADAALIASPGRATAIGEWERVRLEQVSRGKLAIRIGHRDILALLP